MSIVRDNVSPEQYRIWFEPIKAKSLEGKVLTVEVPSEFFREYIEEHFIDLLSRALKRVIGPDVKLIYDSRVTQEETLTYPALCKKSPKNPEVPMPSEQVISSMADLYVIPGLQRMNINPNLNPIYTFDSFIQGGCNVLARAAGLQIAEKPGCTSFNPFFVFGGPGLGKTHLAQAIGIAIKDSHPENVVLYVTANQFITQFIDAVTIKNKMNDFIHFYQSVDTLIIDDIHEFADKKGSQNALFQIFNHLHQLGKQLVLTSDRSPVELQGLETRLLSRFKWGLTAELTPPDYDVRVKILRAKSFNEGITLPDDVIEFLAQKVTGSVRELEGALISLMANATLTKKEISLSLAEELIGKIVEVPKNDITVPKIKRTVCSYFNITDEMLLSSTRKREVVQARQIAMYLSRNMTNMSLDSIGAQIGGKNHATVLYACSTVCDLMDTDKTFRQYLSDIEKILKTDTVQVR